MGERVRCIRCGDPHGALRLPLMVILCNGCASAGTVLTVRCWRCGGNQARVWYPYALCQPCVNVVSPEEIAWMEDPTREPGKATWEMTPRGPGPGGGA